MLICPYCSFSNPTTAVHCLGCGSELPSPEELKALRANQPKRVEIAKPKRVIPALQESPDDDVLGDMDSALNSLLSSSDPLRTAEMYVPQEDPEPPPAPPQKEPDLIDFDEEDEHEGATSLSPSASSTWGREQTEVSRLDPSQVKEIVEKAMAQQRAEAAAREASTREASTREASTREASTREASTREASIQSTTQQPAPSRSFKDTHDSEELPESNPTSANPTPGPRQPQPTERFDLGALRKKAWGEANTTKPDGQSPEKLQDLFADEDDEEPTAKFALSSRPPLVQPNPQAQYTEPANKPPSRLSRKTIGFGEATTEQPPAFADKHDVPTQQQPVRRPAATQQVNAGDWWSKAAQQTPPDTLDPFTADDDDEPTSEISEAQLDELGHESAIESLGESAIIEDSFVKKVRSSPSRAQTVKRNSQREELLQTVPGESPGEGWFDAYAKPKPTTTSPPEDFSSFLIIRLDAVSEREGVPIRRGQRLIALSNLTSQIQALLQEHDLPLEQKDQEQIRARSLAGTQGLRVLVQVAKRILELARASAKEHAGLRCQVRCVVVAATASQDPEQAALDLAQRLLYGMTSDRIWLDWSSYQQLQREFSCTEIVLPSMEEPAYELPVASASQPHALLPAQAQTKLIGRQEQQQQLQQAWNSTLNGAFGVVLLLGEPGSGRTHLLDAWTAAHASNARQFWAASRACPPQQVLSPYLTSLLESHLQRHQIERGQGLYQHISMLAELGQIHHDEPWPDKAATLLDLWSDEPVESRDLEDALSWYLSLQESQGPILLIFDDLYLMDRATLRFAERILSTRPPRTLMIVVSSHGEFERSFYALQQQAHKIELPPLAEHECQQILQALWPPSCPWDDEQARRFLREAEGNPRILISMLTNHLEQLGIKRESTWVEEIAVPAAVEELLLRRMRGLSSLEQDTLRKAAIIGERFWRGAVESLERMELPEGDWGLREGVAISRLDDRSECLRQLESKKLIQREPPSPDSSEEAYHFQQRLMRQALMRQLPKSIRRQMHRRVAEWMILRNEDVDSTAEISTHLKLAGDTEGAARYLLSAGMRALQDSRCSDALRLLSEALEGLGDEPSALRLELLYHLASTYFLVGDLSATIHLCGLGLQLSWRLTSPRWGGKMYTLAGACHSLRLDFIKAEDTLRNGLALSQRVLDDQNIFFAKKELAQLALRNIKREDAQHQLEQLKITLPANPPPQMRAELLTLEGELRRLQGRWADASDLFQRAGSLLSKDTHPILHAIATAKEGELYLTAGDEDAAQTYLWQAAETLRKQQAHQALINTLVLCGQTSLLCRDARAAIQLLREAWQLCQSNGEPAQMTLVAAALSAGYALARQPKDAIHFSRIAEQKLKDIDEHIRAQTFYFLGEAAAALPPEQAELMMEKKPSQLPEGGLATYFFIKALELLEKRKEKGRYCWSLLGLSRALSARTHSRAANHVLERGIRESKEFGLGLLHERFQNQHRLLSGEESDASVPADYSNNKTHSTLVVRTPKKKKKIGRREPPPPPPPKAQPLHATNDLSDSLTTGRLSPPASARSSRNQEPRRNISKPKIPPPQSRKRSPQPPRQSISPPSSPPPKPKKK